MNKVQVGGYTFVSDSKDSDTVTVIGAGVNRAMYRAEAVALFKELKNDSTVRISPVTRRARWAGTNCLRHK